MSQCHVPLCLGTANATTGQCSQCSTPIECATLACKAGPVLLGPGCHWCPTCNRPTSDQVPTQAVAQILQANGVVWDGPPAKRFAGTHVGTSFGTRKLTAGDALGLLALHLTILGRKRHARILDAAVAQYNWVVSDITRAGTRLNLRTQNRFWFGGAAATAKAQMRVAVKREITRRLGTEADKFSVRTERISKANDADVTRPLGTPHGTPACKIAVMWYRQMRLIQPRRRSPKADPIWDPALLKSSSDDESGEDESDSD